MTDLVKSYYDANGVLCKRVIVVNEPNYDHTVHDNLPGEEGWFPVIIDKKIYDAFPDPINVGGLGIHHDMNKAVAAQIAQANPILSATMLANAAAIDAKLASDAKTASDAQAASLAAWNALPLSTQQALTAADSVSLPP